MFPFYNATPDLLNPMMVSVTLSHQQPPSLPQSQQVNIGNSHVLLPRSQSGIGSGSTQTPQFNLLKGLQGLNNINMVNFQIPPQIVQVPNLQQQYFPINS